MADRVSPLTSFEYAVVRVVPRIERAEFVNVGVIVYSPNRDYLAAAVDLDRNRLHALDPEADADEIAAAVESFVGPCTGGTRAGGNGFTGERKRGEWFRWLTAPRSTVVQTGPAHAGLTADPAAELRRLLDRLVR